MPKRPGNDGLSAEIKNLARAIDKLSRGGQRGSGRSPSSEFGDATSRVRGARSPGGGGFLSDIAKLGLTSAASAAASAVGAGLVGVSKGGSLANAAQADLVDTLGRIPVIGELTGFAEVSRTRSTALEELNRLTNPVSRFAGPVNMATRRMAAKQILQQRSQIEDDQKANKNLIEELTRGKQDKLFGQDAADKIVAVLVELAGLGSRIEDTIKGLTSFGR